MPTEEFLYSTAVRAIAPRSRGLCSSDDSGLFLACLGVFDAYLQVSISGRRQDEGLCLSDAVEKVLLGKHHWPKVARHETELDDLGGSSINRWIPLQQRDGRQEIQESAQMEWYGR